MSNRIHGISIFIYSRLIFMVNVGKYTIHGSYRCGNMLLLHYFRQIERFDSFDFETNNLKKKTCWFQRLDSNRLLFSTIFSMEPRHHNCHCCTQGEFHQYYLPIRWTGEPMTPVLQVHVSQGVDNLPPSPAPLQVLWFLDDWMMLGRDSSVIHMRID